MDEWGLPIMSEETKGSSVASSTLHKRCEAAAWRRA